MKPSQCNDDERNLKPGNLVDAPTAASWVSDPDGPLHAEYAFLKPAAFYRRLLSEKESTQEQRRKDQKKREKRERRRREKGEGHSKRKRDKSSDSGNEHRARKEKGKRRMTSEDLDASD
jgi:hypothetical protein